MGNVIPTGSVFCLLGILRMSYVHTVKEYKIVPVKNVGVADKKYQLCKKPKNVVKFICDPDI